MKLEPRGATQPSLNLPCGHWKVIRRSTAPGLPRTERRMTIALSNCIPQATPLSLSSQFGIQDHKAGECVLSDHLPNQLLYHQHNYESRNTLGSSHFNNRVSVVGTSNQALRLGSRFGYAP
ncbi:hypothetical protein FRB94_003086 [Tulasnella sp. JGI-2019a]|nr:hypothetical protein FRB94_003086 [Tulasnella sp. JGI-2019a]